MRRQKKFWNTLLLLKDMVFKNLLFRRKHGLCAVAPSVVWSRN